MKAARHRVFAGAAGCALLLWSAALILGLCCPMVATPSCHGTPSAMHCVSGALEQASPDTAEPILDCSTAVVVPIVRSVESRALPPNLGAPPIRLHLLNDVLRI